LVFGLPRLGTLPARVSSEAAAEHTSAMVWRSRDGGVDPKRGYDK
jgi:hypothetical protein